jgi:hypothetical protein
MASSIDATKPITTSPTTQSVRDNFQAAKDEIEALQDQLARTGTAVLVAGTVTVSDASITANSRILLTANVPGGTPGWLHVSARSAGVSFTITSSSGADTSTVAYFILEP